MSDRLAVAEVAGTESGADGVVYRFGSFELRAESGELLRGGRRVPLAPQPSRLLELLVRRAGHVVSRSEIEAFLWPPGTHVEADQAINFAIHLIRQALDDTVEEPHHLETLRRRGYRFRGPVEVERLSPVLHDRRGRPARPRWAIGATAELTATLAVAALAAFAGVTLAAREQATILEPRPAIRSSVSETAQRTLLLGRFHLAQAIQMGKCEPGSPAECARLAAEREDERLEAVSALRQAIHDAPGLASAHTALSRALLAQHGPRWRVVPAAEAAAQRAIALDASQAEAHFVIAVSAQQRFDWPKAERHLDRALTLDSSHAGAHFLRAQALATRGRHVEAWDAMTRARQLAPEMFLADESAAWLRFFAGDLAAAEAEARMALELAPASSYGAFLALVTSLDAQGREREAVVEVGRLWAQAAVPGETVGPFPDLRAYYDWELAQYGRGELPPGAFIEWPLTWALGLGERDTVFALLESACGYGGWFAAFAEVDPRLAAYRSDPRWTRIRECVGVHAAGA
jgi:DNA-binding winged helix-turn-helix (wHTH) protein/Flp pilus assembly protein TadD